MSTINPFRDLVSSISPTEFEQYCTEILKQYAIAEDLKDFSIQPISLTFLLLLLHWVFNLR